MLFLDLGHQLAVHIDRAFDDRREIGDIHQKGDKVRLGLVFFMVNIDQVCTHGQGIVGNTGRYDDFDHVHRAATGHAEQGFCYTGEEFEEKQDADGKDKAKPEPAFLFFCFFHLPGCPENCHADQKQGDHCLESAVAQDEIKVCNQQDIFLLIGALQGKVCHSDNKAEQHKSQRFDFHSFLSFSDSSGFYSQLHGPRMLRQFGHFPGECLLCGDIGFDHRQKLSEGRYLPMARADDGL